MIRRVKKSLLALTVASLISASTFADMQSDIDDIKSRYLPQIEELKQTAERLRDDLPSEDAMKVGVSFDVDWELQEMKLDIPEFFTELKRIVFDIPTIHNKLQRWVFHTPSSRMENKCILHAFGRCQVKTHIPVFFMQKHEIKLHIPEIHSKRVEIKMHLPVVKMKRQVWKMHLPTIKAGDAKAEAKRVESKVKVVGNKINQLTSAMNTEINVSVSNNLRQKRAEITKKFDEGINGMVKTIQAWSGNKNVNLNAMRDSLAKMRADREKALSDIDKQIAKYS